MSDEKPKGPSADDGKTSIVPSSPGSVSAASGIPAEVLDAMRSRDVDMNVIVVNVMQRAETAEEGVQNARELLQIIKEYQAADVANFKERADAIISAKTRDPDEIDKRKNNQVRRGLKLMLGATGLTSLVGAVVATYAEAPFVLDMGLFLAGVVAMAMSGALATGESVTTADLVRVINAVKPFAGPTAPKAETDRPSDRPNDKQSAARRRGAQ